jgi:hypothetical protein
MNSPKTKSTNPLLTHPKLLAFLGLASGLHCYRCGGRMIYRKNNRSGEVFLGCDKYPECRTTRPIPESLLMEIVYPKLPGF